MSWTTAASMLAMLLSVGAVKADTAATAGTPPASPKLTTAAESRGMIWNAVAVDRGRIFVAGPRWTGSKGPALALIDAHGTARPYPSIRADSV